MRRLLARDARMMDGQVIASLQNGTAFFASTSLIALGGAVKLFHSNEDMLPIVAAPPFGEAVTHTQWELKVVGLMIIFIYAFFKSRGRIGSIIMRRSRSALPRPPPSGTSRRRRP